MDELTSVLSQVRDEPVPRLVPLGAPVSASHVILLASSFDPLTVGHVALAEAASSSAHLTLLVYSPRTLPKDGEPEPPLLAERERLEVVRRFCAGRPWAVPAVASHGLLVEQVVAARRAFPGAAVDLAAGSDKVLQLLDPRWYDEPDRVLHDLLSATTVRYAVRAGDEGLVERSLDRPENRPFAGSFERLPVDPAAAAVSARDVRDRVRRGRPFEHLVPPESVPALRRALERRPGSD